MDSLPGDEEDTPSPDGPAADGDASTDATSPEPQPAPPEDVEREDFVAFVGASGLSKFTVVFDGLRSGRRGLWLCWPGVFAPQIWLLYRKLYLGAAVAFVSPVLRSLFHATSFVQTVGGTCVWIGTGLLGRRLYVAHARRVIAQLRREEGSDDEIRERIRAAGGVSRPGAGIGAAFTLAVSVAGFMTGLLNIHIQH